MAQLVSRHSYVADRLPGKGNGLGQKKIQLDIHFAALFLETPERKLFAEKCISAMDVLEHFFIFSH